MSYCLIPSKANEVIRRLVDGSIDPNKLEAATSAERRAFFEEFLGEHDAINVNALFESKLLLKHRKQGFVTWAKTITGIKPEVRKDILSRIERMEKVLDAVDEDAFLNDLASKKLGVEVTFDEAKKITEASRDIAKKKAAVPKDSPLKSKERLDYGVHYAKFQEYLGTLKSEADAMTWKEWLTSPKQIALDVSSNIKSIVAALDNSFFGRQGIKMLYTNPDIWVKSFLKSFGDIGKELAGADATLAVKADVYSRPNALNGLYKKMDLAIGIAEEAFPSSGPGRIPILGRLFKASESAYNNAALRMRADLADRMLAKAEKYGLDLKDKAQIEPIGKLVNSMTGRGSIGRLEAIGQEINAGFFSIKFFKSNWDTLTAHQFDKTMTPFVRKEAAKNLTKIVASTAVVLWTAQQFWGEDAVEFDPRSTDFGKIKIGDTRFDITGGMSSLVTLASRLMPIKHNGDWGFYTKNSKGKLTKLGSDKYGARTALDVIEDFWEGKLSPSAGFFRDMWQGKDYTGEEFKPGPAGVKLITPIPVQKLQDFKDNPDEVDTLTKMILDGLGLSTSTYR